MQGVGGSSPLVFTTSEQAFYRLLWFFVKIEAYSCLYFSFLQSVTLSARLFCCKYSYDGTQLLPVFCGSQGLALLSAINKKYFSCTYHINKRGHRKDNLSCYFFVFTYCIGFAFILWRWYRNIRILFHFRRLFPHGWALCISGCPYILWFPFRFL